MQEIVTLGEEGESKEEKPCRDQYDKETCIMWRSRGMCTHPNSATQMKVNCPVTCQHCYKVRDRERNTEREREIQRE